MGKTRDLFKNIRNTKRTFHAKMGSIKDRNGMDLTEAGDMKKRWQEYTELYQFVFLPVQRFSWCTLHIGYINRVRIYSLDVLLFLFETSLLFHVQF